MTRHRSPQRPCRAAPFLLALGLCGSAAAQAQALDVKAGLWELTIEHSKVVSQVCYTTEVLQGGLSQVPIPPGMQCRNEVKMATGRSVFTRTVCTGKVSLEGETRVDVLGPEALSLVSGSMLIVDGQKRTIQTTAKARWLRTDCGTVKPFEPHEPTP